MMSVRHLVAEFMREDPIVKETRACSKIRYAIRKLELAEDYNHDAQITPSVAIELEKALRISASFRNNRERRYRESLAWHKVMMKIGVDKVRITRYLYSAKWNIFR